MGHVLEASVALRVVLAEADRIDPVLRVARGDAASDIETIRRSRRDETADPRALGLPAQVASLIPEGTAPFVAVASLLKASHAFDRGFYLAQQPRELDAGADPMTHFLTRGWRDGLAANFYIEPAYYLAQAGIGDAGTINPLFHYLYVGEAAGLRPSPYFEPEWYRTRYGLIGQSPLCHYLRNLHARRFSPNPEFDTAFYLKAYPDVLEDRGDPFRHFILYGRREGRQPRAGGGTGIALNADIGGGRDIAGEIRTILDSTLFYASWYRHHNKLQTNDPVELVAHYLNSPGQVRANPHPLFDVGFYENRNAREIAGVDPLVHYVREGWRRGLDPHPLFDVGFYLEQHADVREARCEPLGHYFSHGWREGRRPCREFDTAYYLETNADVRAQGNDPLTHYIEDGAREGRNPSANFDTAWYVRRILKGRTINPLAHFRASGASEDIFNRTIALTTHYEMPRQDLDGWARQINHGHAPSRIPIDLVRVDQANLEWAITQSRIDPPGRETRRRVYLVCDPGDAVDEALLPHLAHCMETAELGVFDLVFEHDGAWTPVLLPGANAVHLEAVDATFSRFAISSRLLGQLDLARDDSAYGILKAALAQLRAEDRLDLFAHIAMPVLRTEDLSPALNTLRRRLALDAHVGPRSASSGSERSVSVVICSKDRCRLLAQLLGALVTLPPALVREIVVVTNTREDSFAAGVQAHWAGESRIEILRHDGPYNFSTQSNAGAARCSGDLLLFLNDDIVPIVPHWLEVLRAPLARTQVGVTGPLLLYTDERIQHAGLYLGYADCAGHALRGARLPEEDYMLMASAPRNVSAVTGAALLTRRKLFEDLNGFDRQLGTYLQDVDYCLRVLNSDREIVFEPRSFLFHMESVSMRETPEAPVFDDRRPLEHQHFMRRWGHALAGDRFHNPSFELEDETLRTIARGSGRRASNGTGV